MSKNRKGRNVKQGTQTITKKDVKIVTAAEIAGAAARAGGEPVVNLPPAEASKPVLIKVLKPDAKYRGAREAWFMRLKEFDGKPLDEYIANCKEKCPQLTKAQTAENPTGWVSFFKRQGVMTTQQA